MAMGFGLACILIGRLELQLRLCLKGSSPLMLLLIVDSFFPTERVMLKKKRKYLISDSRAC